MKKIISLLLALAMMAAMLTACGSKAPEAPETPEAPSVEVPGSALEVLNNIWALYSEDEKFPVMGGDMNNLVDGAPGNYSLEDTETLAVQLLVPADLVGGITEAASLFHGMMFNNFTCGVFHVKEDAEGFAKVLHESIANAQWMCGMPEKELIAIVGGEYVLMSFGINDAVNPFEAKLQEAYPDAQILYSQPIA